MSLAAVYISLHLISTHPVDNGDVQTKPRQLALRTDPNDMRRYNRLDVRISARVGLVPESSPDDVVWEILRPRAQQVVVSDLSATGLFFVSGSNYELGQQVWISLEIQGTEYPIRAVIVRQKAEMREGRRVYGYGLQFLRSRFAPRAVAAILEYLSQRIAILKQQKRIPHKSVQQIRA